MRLFVDAPGGMDYESLVVIPYPRVMPEFGPWIGSPGVKASIGPVDSFSRVLALSEVEVFGNDLGSGHTADDRAHPPPDSLVGRSSS
jgi:hypothetical protein